jgi:osmotically-inducible protein OsmY
MGEANMFTYMRYARVIACLIVMVVMLGCAGDRTTRSAGETIDDGAIATKVKSALVAAPDVKGTQVQVEVYRGVVQLSGFVDRPAEAQRAVTVARNVAGVKEVRNNLIVK